MLGDFVESVLSLIGITPDRVRLWIGKDCGCKERKERLNALHAWAKRVMRGNVHDAEERLDQLTRQE